MRVRLLGQVVGGDRGFNITGRGVIFSGLKSSARVDRGMQLAYRVRAWRVLVEAVVDGTELAIDGQMTPTFAETEREVALNPAMAFLDETESGTESMQVDVSFPVQSVRAAGDEAAICLEFSVVVRLEFFIGPVPQVVLLATIGVGTEPISEFSADIAGENMPLYGLTDIPAEVQALSVSIQPSEYWEFCDSNGANPIFHPATGEALIPPKQGDISL